MIRSPLHHLRRSGYRRFLRLYTQLSPMHKFRGFFLPCLHDFNLLLYYTVDAGSGARMSCAFVLDFLLFLFWLCWRIGLFLDLLPFLARLKLCLYGSKEFVQCCCYANFEELRSELVG